MPEEQKNPATDEAAMAAAMEAAAEGGGTLSQDEIDSLLGFGAQSSAPATGVQALLERSQKNYERLPMLEVVFDRLVRSLSTSLRNLTSENVDVTIDSFNAMRFEDYLDSVPLPALLGIFQAAEWENLGLITIDSALAYSMVDILLGGGRSNRPVRIEGRPFTTIEQDLVKNLIRVLLEDMSAAFNPLTPVNFRFERLETNPRFATITRPANPAIAIALRIEMDNRGGKATILFPYVTLEPVKELLTQMFAGESFGSDMSWEAHLSQEIRSSTVTVEALLAPKRITLRDLAALEAGQTITMNDKPDSDLAVQCKGIRIAEGRLGSSGKQLAIRASKVHTRSLRKIV